VENAPAGAILRKGGRARQQRNAQHRDDVTFHIASNDRTDSLVYKKEMAQPKLGHK
jgi:hypothetical protein